MSYAFAERAKVLEKLMKMNNQTVTGTEFLLVLVVEMLVILSVQLSEKEK